MQTTIKKKPIAKKAIVKPKFNLKIDTNNQITFNGTYGTRFYVENSEISCGIKQLGNIDSFTAIIQAVESKNDTIVPLAEKLKKVIERVKERNGAAFLICSTTANSEVCKLFDMVAIKKSPIKVNPNSENRIKCFIL